MTFGTEKQITKRYYRFGRSIDRLADFGMKHPEFFEVVFRKIREIKVRRSEMNHILVNYF